MRMIIVQLAAAIVLAATSATAEDRPYAGQDGRAVKALSGEDVAELMAGRGWGLAKPAELNGYPGPVHVLELKEALALTPAQVSAVETVFTTMQERAMALGQAYIEAERALDELFATGTATADALGQRTAAAERLRTELRIAHLQAHLETRPLLTRHQLQRYRHLRGYAAAPGRSHAH